MQDGYAISDAQRRALKEIESYLQGYLEQMAESDAWPEAYQAAEKVIEHINRVRQEGSNTDASIIISALYSNSNQTTRMNWYDWSWGRVSWERFVSQVAPYTKQPIGLPF